MSFFKQRGTAKAQFTKVRTWIDSESDSANLSKLKTKLEMLDRDFEKFAKAQDEIEATCEETSLDTERDERHAIEDQYCDLKSALLDLIESKQSTSSNRENHNSSIHCCSGKSNIDLPQIKLEIFDGKYEEWFQFHDLFVASVEKRKNLTDAQRFYYLRNHLRGEPLKAISQLKVEDKSYRVAMDRLEQRYANKGLILNSHIKALLSVGNCDSNPNSLKNLADTLSVNIQAVNNLGYESNKLSDAIIVYIAAAKLDARTRELWETKIVTKPAECDDLLRTFIKCIDERACTLQAMPPPPPPPRPPYNRNKQLDASKPRQSVQVNVAGIENPSENSNSQPTTMVCSLCSENKDNAHQLFACPVFKAYTYEQRHDYIQKGKRCFNCLRAGHPVANCRSSKCKECGKAHHTLIHRKPKEEVPSTSGENKPSPPADTVGANTASIRDTKNVLIATVSILLESSCGERLPVRAMLDPGAEENFISSRLANQLGLKARCRPVNMVGINNASSNASHETTIKFFSRVTNFSSTTNAIIVPHVTSVKPPSTLRVLPSFDIPLAKLADPDFDKPGVIDLLLCAEYYLDIFTDGYIKGDRNRPSMRNTVFGWIISGRTRTTNSNIVSVRRCEIANALEKFWVTEEICAELPRNVDDEYCEKFYTETVSRDSTGRYTVQLPLKDSVEKLGNSRDTALKILTNLRRRLTDSQFESCKAFMNEYVALGHMSAVPPIETNKPHYYLPYHPVFKESSLTTKTRIVFNGSKPTSTGVAVNDILHKGSSNLQKKLFGNIIHFRLKIVVFCADIAMMYRQVLVHILNRDLQRILWYDELGEIQDFQLNTVTYGMTPSGFLAIRTIIQLANDEGKSYPLAAKALIEDSFVDDIHSGANTKDEAAELVRQLDALVKLGGFTLRKWASNEPSILQSVSSEEDIEFKLNDGDEIGALGLTWRPREDIFVIVGKLPECKRTPTKRIILSESSKLFDPLGLVAPVVLVAKLILKQIWNSGSNWDDPLDPDIERDWLIYRNELQLLKVSIPRLVITSPVVELHGFSDASTKAYGACVYIRAVHPNGTVDMRLLCAKTRVAPAKCDNVPRLELLGALLLARLTSQLHIPVANQCMWSDSTIVLAWLAKQPSFWKQFVANRVKEIQELLPTSCWRYIKSAENPADIASRGVLPSEISGSSLWWNGPSFLHQPFDMPDTSEFVDECAMKEARRQRILTCRINANEHPVLRLIERRSSAKKIIRVTAYCMRFIQNLRVAANLRCREPSHPLSVDELNHAQIVVVKAVQEDGFPDDLRKLRAKGKVGKGSPLLPYSPRLDNHGVLHVGGRLQNARISDEQKYPILLPARHPFSEKIVREVHLDEFHAPTNLIISTTRDQYWIIALKSLARRVVRECPTCRRTNRETCRQIMGNLPEARVNASEFPFLNVGLDFAGPITVKLGAPRSRGTQKAYICIFICLATKGVHIDVSMSLSTESFIAALERFVARRGKPEAIYSDNGTNFQGAANQLEKMCTDNDVQTTLAEKRIRWHFIPPRSPHFGGIWEAAIKSAKTHLKRVIGEAVLSQEQLLTLLAKIEACLNSRPLYEPSDDVLDGPPLTPGHFLIGRPLTSIPQPTLSKVVDNRNKFEQVRRIVQSFWDRWSKEYLNSLQLRTKWKETIANLLVGDIVVIKEVDVAPGKWKMGRVEAVHPGTDNQVRVADVKTESGILRRPITKLIILVRNHN